MKLSDRIKEEFLKRRGEKEREGEGRGGKERKGIEGEGKGVWEVMLGQIIVILKKSVSI